MSDPNDDADLTESVATPRTASFVVAQCDQRLALGRPSREDAAGDQVDRTLNATGRSRVMRR